MGTATDVANAVLFLSSEESSFITGLEVPVDGGTLAMIGHYQRPAIPGSAPTRERVELTPSASAQ
jgi:hypothetical protein